MRGWADTLEKWVAELAHLSPNQVKAHVLRTRRSLRGMGSIGDIVICPQAGNRIANDEQAISAANDRLLNLVDDLSAETARYLDGAAE